MQRWIVAASSVALGGCDLVLGLGGLHERGATDAGVPTSSSDDGPDVNGGPDSASAESDRDARADAPVEVGEAGQRTNEAGPDATTGDAGVCALNATRCAGTGVETCGSNGQWGSAQVCPKARQSCAVVAGVAGCACNVDPVCSTVGGVCANQSTLASCDQDVNGCFYESQSMGCSNGACSGGACCTNVCTAGMACLATSSTAIQTCALATDGCTAATTAACAANYVCERPGGASCVDPTWAEWPMPNSQNDSNAGAANLESYTDNGDGTITDNVTGLVWQKAAGGTYDQADALTFCAGLTFNGFSDWRLPSLIELVSLIDIGQSAPAINLTYFPGTRPGGYWSSSTNGANVEFESGGVGFSNLGLEFPVRCVR